MVLEKISRMESVDAKKFSPYVFSGEWLGHKSHFSQELITAIESVKLAADILESHSQKPFISILKGNRKTEAIDYLTEIDMLVEATIINNLSRIFPAYGFIAEEQGMTRSDRSNPVRAHSAVGSASQWH